MRRFSCCRADESLSLQILSHLNCLLSEALEGHKNTWNRRVKIFIIKSEKTHSWQTLQSVWRCKVVGQHSENPGTLLTPGLTWNICAIEAEWKWGNENCEVRVVGQHSENPGTLLTPGLTCNIQVRLSENGWMESSENGLNSKWNIKGDLNIKGGMWMSNTQLHTVTLLTPAHTWDLRPSENGPNRVHWGWVKME